MESLDWGESIKSSGKPGRAGERGGQRTQKSPRRGDADGVVLCCGGHRTGP
jgi:hypothetical protein